MKVDAAWNLAAGLLHAVLLLAMPGPSAHAADAGSGHVAKRLDPTDFRTRLDFRNKYQAPQTGGYRNLATPRLDYAFSKTFAMRVELPYVHSAPRTPGVTPETGMGDLLLRANIRAFRSQTLALVIGTELDLDTAESRQLGSGKHVIAPVAFLSLDAPALHTTFFPTWQYFRSFAGDARRPDIDYTSLKVFALTRWPANFYTGTETVLFIDHARRNRVGATLEVETGRFLSPHVAVWVRPGIGTHGDDTPQVYRWNFEIGFRYLFD